MTFGRKGCREGIDPCDPKSIREALYCQTNHSQMTRNEIAEVMGINPSTLGRWSDPQSDEHIPEQRLAHLLALTDDRAVYVTYLGSLQGLVVYDPKSAGGDVTRMVTEFGELLKAMDSASADGTVTHQEADRIEREGAELIAAVRRSIEEARTKAGPKPMTTFYTYPNSGGSAGGTSVTYPRTGTK